MKTILEEYPAIAPYRPAQHSPMHSEGSDQERWVFTWQMDEYVAQAIRQHMRFFCGYLAIPCKHPWHEVDYSKKPLSRVNIHGGLTYACKSCVDDSWVVGFDCAHSGDLVPALESMRKYKHIADILGFEKLVYRNVDYVFEQLEKLANQARDAATKVEQRAFD